MVSQELLHDHENSSFYLLVLPYWLDGFLQALNSIGWVSIHKALLEKLFMLLTLDLCLQHALGFAI